MSLPPPYQWPIAIPACAVETVRLAHRIGKAVFRVGLIWIGDRAERYEFPGRR